MDTDNKNKVRFSKIFKNVGVRVGVASCWNKLALSQNLKDLHVKSQHSRCYSWRDLSNLTDGQTEWRTDVARSTR